MSRQSLTWVRNFVFRGVDSTGSVLEMDGDGETAVKPADLLPLSVAACTAYDIVNILRKQRQDLHALDAEIETVQDDESPWPFRSIAVRYRVRGRVDATKAAKALELAEGKYCSVSETLRHVVDLRFTIEVEDEPLSGGS